MGLLIVPVEYSCKECNNITKVHVKGERTADGGVEADPDYIWRGRCEECGTERQHHFDPTDA